MLNQILLQDFLAQMKNKNIADETTRAEVKIVNTDYKITETRIDQFDLKISLVVRVFDNSGNLLDRGYNLSITKRNLKDDKDLNSDIEAISEPLQHEIMSGIQVRAREIANIAQQ